MSFVPVRLLLSLLQFNHYHVVATVATFVGTEVYYASIIQNNLDHTLYVLLLLMFFGEAQQYKPFLSNCIIQISNLRIMNMLYVERLLFIQIEELLKLI